MQLRWVYSQGCFMALRVLYGVSAVRENSLRRNIWFTRADWFWFDSWWMLILVRHTWCNLFFEDWELNTDISNRGCVSWNSLSNTRGRHHVTIWGVASAFSRQMMFYGNWGIGGFVRGNCSRRTQGSCNLGGVGVVLFTPVANDSPIMTAWLVFALGGFFILFFRIAVCIGIDFYEED